MTETLALRYRPRRFSDITGQRSVRLILHEMVKQGKVPTGLLFTGVRGTGKTTSGRILAAALNCEAELVEKPCGECVHCKAIFNGQSLDVLEIDAASNGNVESIRQLLETLRYSVGGQKRVVLLDEAHSMSREANNALLKGLEEPPADTVFVLLTTEPGRILETVHSRLMPFEFRRISTSDIVERLSYVVSQEQFEVDSELVALIAERANGGMRDAIMTLDQVTRVGVRTVGEFEQLLGESDFAPAIIRAMVDGDHAVVLEALDGQLARTGDAGALAAQLVLCLRDMLVLQSGGVVSRQGKGLSDRQALSAMVPSETVVAALRVLWDLKTKVRLGDDPRVALDLAGVLVTEALAGKSRPRASASQPAPRLTLDQMRRM